METKKWVFPRNTKEIMEDYWFLRAEGFSASVVQEVLVLAYPEAEICGCRKGGKEIWRR